MRLHSLDLSTGPGRGLGSILREGGPVLLPLLSLYPAAGEGAGQTVLANLGLLPQVLKHVEWPGPGCAPVHAGRLRRCMAPTVLPA